MSHGKTLGIISGSGPVPAIVAKNARDEGYGVVSVALAESRPVGLRAVSDHYHRISIAHAEQVIRTLTEEGVRDLVIVGKVPKKLHFEHLSFDERALAMLSRLSSRDDASLFHLVAEEMEREGFCIRKQTDFLGRFLAKGGVLTARAPSKKEMGHLRRAIDTARRIAGLGIGQTIVVWDGLVIAVEAFEHTDAAIRRAGRLAGPGTAVIKVSRPDQDPRFDVPTVGLSTLKTMLRSGARTLVVEKGRTFLLDGSAMVEFADLHGMSIVVL